MDRTPGGCPIAPLTPITDPLARRMEDGERILWDGADPRLRPAAERLVALISAEPNGSARVTSAYRPQPYQDHLREVWDKARDDRLARPECADRKREVDAEMAGHGLSTERPVARSSNHTTGRAVDIAWRLPDATDPSARVAELAASAGLRHPMPAEDHVHFELA